MGVRIAQLGGSDSKFCPSTAGATETPNMQGLKNNPERVSQRIGNSAKGVKVVTVTLNHTDKFFLDREDREY